jgi:putative flavoprotein involved in K+ transport
MSDRGRSHVILEGDRLVESWRTRRWDSLRLIAPNWSLVLPGFSYTGDDPDGFMCKDEVVEHLVGYARSFNAPVREGVRVTRVAHELRGAGFVVHTSEGQLCARNVALATGALQRPNLPAFASKIPPEVAQLVGSEYRSPQTLPPGKVLIVGSGETGCQIAEELARAGRDVSLSWGRSWWLPRRYRGRDIAAWLRLVGWFDRKTDDLPRGVRAGEPNPQLTGADGGHDISAHTLARDGVRLLGRLLDVQVGCAYFADDLATNVRSGDNQAAGFLDRIDALVDDERLDVPPPDRPDDLALTTDALPVADLSDAGTAKLELLKEGIDVVLWATGYRHDFEWVGLPFLAPDGFPIQSRGVTAIPGLYVLGLDWLYNAKSGLFAGLGDDAAHVASVIDSG